MLRKLNRHILVKFFAMTVLCYIDRTNLAFAALQLNRSLGFTEYVYGVGSGIFFVGYSLFMVRWHSHTDCLCYSCLARTAPAVSQRLAWIWSTCTRAPGHAQALGVMSSMSG